MGIKIPEDDLRHCSCLPMVKSRKPKNHAPGCSYVRIIEMHKSYDDCHKRFLTAVDETAEWKEKYFALAEKCSVLLAREEE